MAFRYIPMFVFIAAFALLAPNAFAEDAGIRQFQRDVRIGGRLPATLIIIGQSKDAKGIEKLIDIVTDKANGVYERLSTSNPQSDIANIESKATQGPVKVSSEVISAFETAVKVAKWTNGAFDLVKSGDGDWRDIKISSSSDTIELKKAGLKLSFDNMINGFISEFVARLIYAAGMQNAMVKVGTCFRGIGSNIHGPWKIEVEDQDGTFAHRALNLTVTNIGVAVVSASAFRSKKVINPRTKGEVSSLCRGVVITMPDIAEAEALANAVFVLGPTDGMNVLSKYARGLVVDVNGNFLRSPGF